MNVGANRRADTVNRRILVVAGIFAIIRKELLWGIVLIVVGLAVGPGGVSIFT